MAPSSGSRRVICIWHNDRFSDSVVARCKYELYYCHASTGTFFIRYDTRSQELSSAQDAGSSGCIVLVLVLVLV